MSGTSNGPTAENLFLIETPPFLHNGYTVRRMSLDTCLALLPAGIMSVVTFGLPALWTICLAVGTAILTEVACQHIVGRRIRVDDGTALIAGLLFAFLLPAGAPWWLVLVGTAFMMVFGKHVFGGIGAAPFCAPLIGWAALTVAWPTFMDAHAVVLNTDLFDPLLKLKYAGAHSLPEGSELSLLLGKQLGGLGATQVGLLALGGLYVAARRAVRFEATFGFLVGVLGLGTVFWCIDPGRYVSPELYLLTGSTVLAAFFLITDHSSTPVASVGLLLSGLLAGCMTVLIRVYGAYPDGAPFAILVTNLFTPVFDMIRPAPYGKRR